MNRVEISVRADLKGLVIIETVEGAGVRHDVSLKVVPSRMH
jgi:hypothetical protein